MRKNTITAASTSLVKNDPVMKRLVLTHGPCTLTPHSRYYEELASSIVSQQLSVKAAATIWQRFLGLFDGKMPTPKQIIASDVDMLRGVGLSNQKASYIRDLAYHIENGTLKIDQLPRLSNDEIISELVAVRGIGVWSAHMFLIFSLARPDVLAWGDLGIKKSAQTLYHLSELPSRDKLEELALANGWTGSESVACWYLWKNLDNKPS